MSSSVAPSAQKNVVVIEEGYLKGPFRGYRNKQTLFDFKDGNRWLQDEYQYQYLFINKPKARITKENGLYYIEVEGMGVKVKVIQISV